MAPRYRMRCNAVPTERDASDHRQKTVGDEESHPKGDNLLATSVLIWYREMVSLDYRTLLDVAYSMPSDGLRRRSHRRAPNKPTPVNANSMLVGSGTTAVCSRLMRKN